MKAELNELITRVGTGTAFVDAHLARADDAVHMRLGHALEVAQEEVVQPLPVGAFVDLQPLNRRNRPGIPWLGRRSAGTGHGNFAPYNPALHVRAVSA